MKAKIRLLPALAACAVVTPVLAEPVTYQIASDHTYPSFEAPHMGISWWRGKFNQTSGSVTLDREAETGTVDIVIDASSIDFGHDKMNDHARNADFFNVEEYPEITYTGTIEFDDGEPDEVDGELTLLGTTRPVKLDIESFKCIQHPMYKKEVCGADVEAEFNRGDFGMGKYGEGDAGIVRLQIQVEAMRSE